MESSKWGRNKFFHLIRSNLRGETFSSSSTFVSLLFHVLLNFLLGNETLGKEAGSFYSLSSFGSLIGLFVRTTKGLPTCLESEIKLVKVYFLRLASTKDQKYICIKNTVAQKHVKYEVLISNAVLLILKIWTAQNCELGISSLQNEIIHENTPHIIIYRI